MMSKNKKIRIAVVGLNFGGAFVPIYQAHPNVEYVGICDMNNQRLNAAGDRLQIDHRHSDIEEITSGDEYDAVHIVTPVPTHVPMTIAVMNSGKHCACAVPMGISIDDLNRVLETQRKTRLVYMMMETNVYCREYLYAKELYEKGVLGQIQFMRGAHYQDYEGLNPAFMGLPPMYYMTHAISPLLDILHTRATKVHCLGSGAMREELTKQYKNPYPIQTAIFRLEGTSVAAEVTRTLFETAIEYKETFDIFGDKSSFLCLGDSPRLATLETLVSGRFRGCKVERNIDVPFRPDLLPAELAKFASGGHGGSHPHLVHEFVRSIVEERQPHINAVTSANWTVPGICAHDSAMKGGAEVAIPSF